MEFLIENRELIDAVLVAVLIIIVVLGLGVSYLIISKKEKNEKKRKVEHHITIDATVIIVNTLLFLRLFLELIAGVEGEETILTGFTMVLIAIVIVLYCIDLKEECQNLSNW